MPVINTYDKPAGEIKFGNYVFGQKVKGAYPKRVNTRIVLEQPVDGKTEWIFRLTDMLEVGVSELTPEEKAAKKAEDQKFREEHFIKAVRDYPIDAKAELQKAVELRQKRLADGWGQLDYYTIQTELAAYALADVGREIQAVWDTFDDGTLHAHPGKDCEYGDYDSEVGGRKCTLKSETTELQVAIDLVERFKDRVMSKAMDTRVFSRSTSTISNLCDDMQLAACADFLKSLSYSAAGIVKLPSRW